MEADLSLKRPIETDTQMPSVVGNKRKRNGKCISYGCIR